MAGATICLYNKYGYCKYKNLCRYHHVVDKCEDENCDVTSCFKRHPKTCRYFYRYNRCKFNDSCSFSHISSTVRFHADKDENVKSRLSHIEESNVRQANDLMNMKFKLEALEKENEFLKDEVKKIPELMKSATEKVVNVTIETVLGNLNAHQKALESETNTKLNVLQDQIASLLSMLNAKPATTQPNLKLDTLKPPTSNSRKPTLLTNRQKSLP